MNICNSTTMIVILLVSNLSFCMQSLEEQARQRTQDQINAAVARNYTQSGQQVPPQLMAKLSAGELAIARHNNQKVAEWQTRQNLQGKYQ